MVHDERIRRSNLRLKRASILGSISSRVSGSSICESAIELDLVEISLFWSTTTFSDILKCAPENTYATCQVGISRERGRERCNNCFLPLSIYTIYLRSKKISQPMKRRSTKQDRPTLSQMLCWHCTRNSALVLDRSCLLYTSDAADETYPV